MKKILLLLLLTLNIVVPTYSQISATAALIALDEIDAMAKEHLQSIDNLATNAIGNGGNMLLSMSAKLRKDINETIGNTDKILRENQLLIYNKILSLKNEFNKTIEENLNKVDLISTKISQAANDMFLKKNEPNIFQYKTSRFVNGLDNEYTLIIKGTSFDRSYEIFIELDNQIIKPIQSSYSELIFKIDSTFIKPVDFNKSYASGKINFKWKKGLFKTKKTNSENFFIPIVPLKIGKAQAFYEQDLPYKKLHNEIPYSCNCDTGPTRWDGQRRHNTTAFNILPTGARKIDPKTIKVTSWHQRNGGGYTFSHKTEQQLKGEITCDSEDTPMGGGGFSKLSFTYQEFEILYRNTKNSTSTQELTSINPLLFDLPAEVDGKKPNLNFVEITTYDGKNFTLTPNDTNKYFSLKVNPVTLDISISWKK